MADWFRVLVDNINCYVDNENDIIFYRKGTDGMKVQNWLYLYCPEDSLSLHGGIRLEKYTGKYLGSRVERTNLRWERAPKRMYKVLRAVAFPLVIEDPTKFSGDE